MLPLRGGLAPLTLASKVAVIPWYLSGGISAANCIAAYAPKGAASLAASYSNLANPGTYNAAPGVAPTFNTATGWTFNGSSQYLTTGVAANTIQSMIVRFTNGDYGTYAGVIGAYTSDSNAIMIMQWHAAGGVVYYNGGSSGVLKAPKLAAGILAVAGAKCYRNGVEDATISGTGSRPSSAILIGQSAGSYFGGKIQAAAIYNTTITAAQVLAVTNAMNAL